MTPKERATDLLNKMKEQMRGPGIEAAEGNAKRCAIVAVDLLIKHLSDSVYTIGRGCSDKEYWQFVKAHLEL